MSAEAVVAILDLSHLLQRHFHCSRLEYGDGLGEVIMIQKNPRYQILLGQEKLPGNFKKESALESTHNHP